MATVTTKPSLTIKRRFKAPPAKVFAAWTDPEKLKHWMGGREIASVTAQADVRVTEDRKGSFVVDARIALAPRP